MTCLSVHPISPSLFTWLTSNHHCIFTMSSTCTWHYYFGSPTFDLDTMTLTFTLLVTTKLPEPNITSIPKWYICCILPYIGCVWRAVTLVDIWSTCQGQIGYHNIRLCLLVQYCLNKTSHQCQSGTFGEFYQYLGWVLTLTYFSRSDKSAQLVCPSNFS